MLEVLFRLILSKGCGWKEEPTLTAMVDLCELKEYDLKLGTERTWLFEEVWVPRLFVSSESLYFCCFSLALGFCLLWKQGKKELHPDLDILGL